MDDEDLLCRPTPLFPYMATDAVLRLPPLALTGTLDLLRRAGRRECGAFWYGERAPDGSGQVKLVVAPRQTMSRGNYQISAQAIAELVRQLPETWRPLAQVHSHPGVRVEHSRYDDRMAMSRRALSLVFPFYGRYAPAAFPAGVGVHEHQSDHWHLLSPRLAAERVRMVEGDVQVVDLR